MIKPLGNMVLIKAKKIEEKTSGGIILPEEHQDKQQAVEQTGEIISFGPTAFKRWKGCESPRWFKKASMLENVGEHAFNALCDHWKWEDPDYPPHRQWGLEIGDFIEHRRYNAMNSVFRTEDDKIYRYIPDIEIIGKVEKVS